METGLLLERPEVKPTNTRSKKYQRRKRMSPYNHRKTMRRIAGHEFSSKQPVLRIDLDPQNNDDYNLYLFKSPKDLHQAIEDLTNYLNSFIKKGLLSFSKRTGLYDFVRKFKTLVHKTPTTELYKGREVDLETDLQLNQLRKSIQTTTEAQKDKFLRSPRGCSDQNIESLNFKPSRGYRGIMERIIRRPLKPGEEVHHIDHNHFNNKDENLFLCSDQEHHKNIHKLLNKLATVLIRKGLISFSHKEGTYKLSKTLQRILPRRQVIKPHKTKKAERIERDRRLNPTIDWQPPEQVSIKDAVEAVAA